MFYFTAAFDLALMPELGELAVDAAGEDPITVNLSELLGVDSDSEDSSIVWHTPVMVDFWFQSHQDDLIRSTYRKASLSGLALLLQTALRAAATAEAWAFPNDINVTWPADSLAHGVRPGYQFEYNHGGGISLTFDSAEGRALLGYLNDESASTTQVGEATPTFVLCPTLTAVSRLSGPDRESEGIAASVRTDGGGHASHSRLFAPLQLAYWQEYERPEKTLKQLATVDDPWSHQHLREHCRRTGLPFYVHDGSFGTVANNYRAFSFTSAGLVWSADFQATANSRGFHIPYDCISDGYGASLS